MSEVPDGLFYTKEHEWIRVEGDEVVIGITDHAQDALTDIVYIELPEVGEVCEDMGEFAVVESVKSASPIFAPLAGEITAVNEAMLDDLTSITPDRATESWLFKVKVSDTSELDEMMDEDAYKAMIA